MPVLLKKQLHRFPGNEHGSAMAEFAFVVGLTLLILFATVEFGFLLNTQLTLANAVRVGARRASVDGGASPAVYEKIDQQLMFGRINPQDVDVYISPYGAPHGQRIHLRLTYTYRPLTPLMRILSLNGIPLKSEVVTRSEKVW